MNSPRTRTVLSIGAAVLQTGASIYMTPCGDEVYLFTDRGNLIQARLTPAEYREICRAHLMEPTTPFGAQKFAWTPPAYAHRCVFARTDAEIVCASLAHKRTSGRFKN